MDLAAAPTPGAPAAAARRTGAASLAASAVASVCATAAEALLRGGDLAVEQPQVRWEQRGASLQPHYKLPDQPGNPQDAQRLQDLYRAHRQPQRPDVSSTAGGAAPEVGARWCRPVAAIDPAEAHAEDAAGLSEWLREVLGSRPSPRAPRPPADSVEEGGRPWGPEALSAQLRRRGPGAGRGGGAAAAAAAEEAREAERRRAAAEATERRRREVGDDFLVDESWVGGDCSVPGVIYRRSKDLQDRDAAGAVAHWGTTITGFDQGDGWLKVGTRYLPMRIQGAPVLKCLAQGADPDGTDLAGALERIRTACAAQEFLKREATHLGSFRCAVAEPEALPLSVYRVAVVPRIAIRVAPSSQAPIVDCFPTGAALTVTAEKRGLWLKVSRRSWSDPADVPQEAWVLSDGRAMGIGRLLEPVDTGAALCH